MIHVVTGAPCSGKTTFVNERKSDGDVVIDLDSIAEALGASNRYDYHGSIRDAAFAARKAAISAIGDGNAWIIHSQPTAEQRAEYGDAVFHDLDPGRDECVSRARNDGRPAWTESAINKWYEKSGSSESFFLPNVGAIHGQSMTATELERGQTMSEATPSQVDNNATQGATADKTFTQAEMDAIIGERLGRLKAKYADYDEVKAKAAKFDEAEEASKTELQKAVEERDALKAQLEKMEADKARADAIAKAASEHGVDVGLLSRMSGDPSENAAYLKAQMAAQPKYGQVPDGGEPTAPTITRESIEAIKDPVERVRMRAQHQELFQ